MEENVDIMMTQDKSAAARRIVLGLAGLNAVIIVVAIVLGLRLPASPSSEEFIFAYSWILTSVIYSVLAVLIIFRQPRHVIGWLFAAVGFLNALTLFGILLGDYIESSIIGLPASSEQAQAMFKFIGELIWIFGLFIPSTLMLQFFPNGRLPSRRWWPITLATIIGFLSLSVGFIVEESGYEGPFAWLANLSLVFMLISIFGSLAAVVVRFIRSKDAERLQMKWLVYTSVVGVLFMFLLTAVLGEESPILGLYTTLLPSMLAISVGVAILRYRLYDIDIIIRRTLQYGIVTGLLILIYFGMVVIFQSLFVAVGNTESSIFIVISTLVVAGLFNPLRVRVQKGIDRRFFRRKYDAQRIMAQFGNAVVDEVDMSNLAKALVEAVEQTMQPELTSLWLKPAVQQWTEHSWSRSADGGSLPVSTQEPADE